MNGISCDRCDKGLLIDEEVRYEVKIVVKAAWDPMELTREDLARDRREEMKKTLQEMNPLSEQEAMDQVYREFRYDLCPSCQKEYLKKHL